MVEESALHLFEGFGVELEYMIVDRETLAVSPVCDRLLSHAAGENVSEVELGPLAWSNELVLHVIELKTNGPAPILDPLPALFQADVRKINAMLAGEGACLLPTGMHPLMDPHKDTRIWPHEYTDVYRAYDRIFGCRGHGWSNLQSTHVNLPFGSDEEFGRLHAAIRLVLPILPALAASSPIVEGRVTGMLDSRLDAYRFNQAKVPACAGHVIPEAVHTRAEYHSVILEPLYRAMEPYDPEGILRHEWLNSRGAIARFDRQAIEIRLLDIQECPAADLSVAALVVETVRAIAEGRLAVDPERTVWAEDHLSHMLHETIRMGEEALLVDAEYLRILDFPESSGTAGELWRHLASRVLPDRSPWRETLETIFTEGPLARRILRRVGTDPDEARIRDAYHGLARCLFNGELFHV